MLAENQQGSPLPHFKKDYRRSALEVEKLGPLHSLISRLGDVFGDDPEIPRKFAKIRRCLKR